MNLQQTTTHKTEVLSYNNTNDMVKDNNQHEPAANNHTQDRSAQL